MDRDQVLGYMSRLNNEWEATDKAVADAFLKVREGKTRWKALPFSIYDWRQDFYAWGKWYADVKDDWIIGADEYNAAVGWDARLKQWQSKMTDMLQELPTAPVPDKAPTVVDDISKAGGGIASGIGVWLAAGLVAYGAIRYKSKS